MATKTIRRAEPDAETAEGLMEEIIESAKAFEKFYQRLQKTRRNSEAYFDLLSELWAEAEVLRTKAAHSKEATDRLMDALSPEDD
ncbi:MAG TPA: hypothetical protein VFZ08_12415 [Terriglobia bacterium]|nr:hypothetical protein [Terriglobia bacterium]